jgi:CubicO group peptidase (beta-lactamase class C family)
MHRSSYIWQSAFEANYADPHDAEVAPGTKTKPSVPNTAASLQTTGDDFARFLEAVLSGAGLRRDTARLWLEPQVHLHDMQIAWGLGWGLETKSGAAIGGRRHSPLMANTTRL